MKKKIIITCLLVCMLASLMVTSVLAATQKAWSTWAYRPNVTWQFSTTSVKVQEAKVKNTWQAWQDANTTGVGDLNVSLEFEFRPVYTNGVPSDPITMWKKTTSGSATWPNAYYEFDEDDISLASKTVWKWQYNKSYSASLSLAKQNGVTDSTIKERRYLFELERGKYFIIDSVPAEYVRYNVSSGAGTQCSYGSTYYTYES